MKLLKIAAIGVILAASAAFAEGDVLDFYEVERIAQTL